MSSGEEDGYVRDFENEAVLCSAGGILVSVRTSFLVGLVLAVFMFVRGYHSLKQKSATFDEWGHIENGLALTRPNDGRFNLELTHLINPPLAKALAVSVVGTKEWEEVPTTKPRAFRCRAERKLNERLAAFPFSFAIDSIKVLQTCRLPVLVMALFGIPLLFMLCRELGVSRAGPWAALIYAACPNILAHARLATPDLPVTILFLASTLSWLRVVRKPTVARAGIAGVVLGLALAVKYSAMLLIPVLAVAALAAEPGKRFRVLGLSVGAGLVAGLVVVVLYDVIVIPALGPWPWRGEHGHEVSRFAHLLRTWFGQAVALPIVLYRYGGVVASRAAMKSFLVGHHTLGGWTSYFPIAMSIKTPLILILTLATTAGWALRDKYRVNRSLLWVAAVPVVYVLVTVAIGIQVGIRHVLPVYPFMALFGGMLLSSWWTRGKRFRRVAAPLAILLVLEGAFIHPHYLAYFNLATGGPDNGYRYLVDCNLDWGQDLPALAVYQREQNLPTVNLSYFGSDAPGRYGVDYAVHCTQRGDQEPPPGVYAISATNAQGLYAYPLRMRELAWFRSREPSAIVAHSILVYDLRR